MVEYDFNKGLMPYPLSFLPSDGGTVDDDFTANDPEVEDDSTNWFVVCLTTQQMVDLQSVLALGAPIAFPDTYNEIIQFWMQVREYPNEIPESSCMDLCALILDCIEDTTAIQQAIASYSVTSPIDTSTIESQTALDTELITTQGGCDNDNIFGMTSGLADFFNTMSLDLIEIVTNAPSLMARMGDLIEGLPGVGILPFDDVMQFSEAWMDDIQSAYVAAYTAALRNEIRCALFCIAQDTCELTMEQVRDYFYDELSEVLTFDTFGEFMEGIILTNLVGQSVVWGMHLVLAEMLVYGSTVFGHDIGGLHRMVNALFNDDDADWATICSECAWTETWDFTTDDFDEDGWTAQVGDGWFNTLGYRSENVGSQELNYLWCTLPADADVYYYSFTFASPDQTNFDTGTFYIDGQWVFEGDSTTTYHLNTSGILIAQTHVMYNDVDVFADMIRTNCNPKFIGSGKWYITGCTIKGTGVNPFA